MFEAPNQSGPDEPRRRQELPSFAPKSEKPLEPPLNASHEPTDPPIDLPWADEAEGIDEAIEEIRRISDGDDERELPLSERAEAAPGQIVAGRVELERPVPYATASAAACRVQTQSENEIGHLWSSVFFSVELPAPRAVVVTSARRGDGATQIATALALIGAEANAELRICLVDFNLRSPSVASILRIGSTPGLTDVLSGRAKLDDAIHAVTLRDCKQLHVLPAGTIAAKPLGLLKSRQVQSLLATLRDRYDHTIIDTASANAYPDPQVIGAQVDGALLIVQAGQTPRETAAEAKKRLDHAGVRCLGVVLNQRTDPIPGLLYRMT